jgi:hypothetical protein
LASWALALFVSTPTVASAFGAIWTPTAIGAELPRAVALEP